MPTWGNTTESRLRYNRIPSYYLFYAFFFQTTGVFHSQASYRLHTAQVLVSSHPARVSSRLASSAAGYSS